MASSTIRPQRRRRRRDVPPETAEERRARELAQYSRWAFQAVDEPQQWIDRMDAAAIDFAHLRRDNRSAALSMGTASTLRVDEIWPRELTKLRPQMRGRLCEYPQTNGLSPKPKPAPKPWEVRS